MRITLVAAFAALALACNSAPQNTCVLPGNSAISGSTPASNCNGVCVSLTGAETDQVCLVDCTGTGDSVCEAGVTSCFSVAPISTRSYCLPPCGGDAGACPLSSLTCSDAGFCF